MNDITEQDETPSVAPTLQLSRRGLVVSLTCMVAAGLTVYSLFPDAVNGRSLPVDVRLDMQPVIANDGSGAVMTEVVLVENLSDHDIPRLSVEINGQYLLHRDSPLPKKQTLVLPQRIFTDKRSSVRLDPLRYPVKEIVVTGQLPTSARGLSKFEFEREANESADVEEEHGNAESISRGEL